ncbi:MAG: 50S ribosomal protein L21 [bacterium]
MYAVFSLGSHQYRVEPESEVTVFRRDYEEGETFDIEDVLLIKSDDEDAIVGTPEIEEASITATVDEHFRGDKITVFNYKRREGRRRKLGHRDDLTRLRINDIKTP